MTNIANWKDPPFLRMVNYLFLWAIYTMAKLLNKPEGQVYNPPQKKTKTPSRIQCARRGFLKVFTRFEKWNFAVDESKGADFREAKHGGVWWSWHGVPPTLLTGHVHGRHFLSHNGRHFLHGDKANTLEVQGMKRIKIKPFNMAFWYPFYPWLEGHWNSSKLSLYTPQPLQNCNTYSHQYALRLVNLLI